MWSSVSGKPAVLDCRCTLHAISCMLSVHTQRLNANHGKCIACQVASKLSIKPATDADVSQDQLWGFVSTAARCMHLTTNSSDQAPAVMTCMVLISSVHYSTPAASTRCRQSESQGVHSKAKQSSMIGQHTGDMKMTLPQAAPWVKMTMWECMYTCACCFKLISSRYITLPCQATN